MDYITITISIFAGIIGIGYTAYQVYDLAKQASISSDRIKKAESKVQAEPEKVKPAWDLARATLEAYLNRNLNQITAIFTLSVMVMLVGFFIVIWGISSALQNPSSITPAVLASTAGVITEFIGGTFLLIYRSTLEQAANYSKMLERINSVGMAMQIIDTMPEEIDDKDLKNKTKATLVELLVKESHKEDLKK